MSSCVPTTVKVLDRLLSASCAELSVPSLCVFQCFPHILVGTSSTRRISVLQSCLALEAGTKDLIVARLKVASQSYRQMLEQGYRFWGDMV